jgi:adenosine deaminase
MRKSDFYELLKAVPKSEIHVHAEAIISKSTIKKFLQRRHTGKPSDKEIKKLLTYNSLKEFIDSFILVQDLFESPEDFNILFDDILLYLTANNIVYSELFFSPSFFLKNEMEFDEIIKVISSKIEEIAEKEKIIIKLIVDISRTFGYENALNNYNLVKKHRNDHIIGIGLGGDELKGPAVMFTDLFEKARKNNFHVVAHAGEDDGPSSVWDALKALKAERIGHGIASVQDEALMEYLQEKRIPLEICMTSNIFTKKVVTEIEKHPIKEFYKRDILVTLNTDDPTFFDISLIDEYWNLHDKLGFSMSDIKNVIINGFQATFLPEKDKKRYIREVEKTWEKYMSEMKVSS